jgi:hypothetical protein
VLIAAGMLPDIICKYTEIKLYLIYKNAKAKCDISDAAKVRVFARFGDCFLNLSA